MPDYWDKDLDYDFDAEDNDDDVGGAGDDGGSLLWGAQHIIALIDCDPAMFRPVPPASEDKEDDGGGGDSMETKDRKSATPFELSLQTMAKLVEMVIENTVTRKMGKRDGVGILLYNTKPQKGKDTKGANKSEDDMDDDDKMDNDDDSENGSRMDDSSDDGSAASNDADAQTNVHTLLDLAPPGLKEFQTLHSMVEKKSDDLKEEFCPSAPVDQDLRNAPLQNAFEEAQRIFIKSKYVKDNSKAKTSSEKDSRIIWIFTNQAEPYSSELRGRIENVAKEAKDQSDVEILVWPLAMMSASGGPFLNGPFVSPFFRSFAPDDFDKRFQDFEELQDNGLDDAYVKQKKHRRSYYGPLHILRSSIGRDASITIEWYTLVQVATRPSKVKINDEKKNEVIRERKMLEKDTGIELATFRTKLNVEEREAQNNRNELALQRLREFYSFVQEDVRWTSQDTKDALKMANGGYKTGLTILGFKPRDSIPFYHSIGAPYLIYPNDTEVQGSVDAFARLHSSMLRKNVLAIGEALFREFWQSRLVAIYPLEKSPEEQEAGKPAGMLVIQLPFEDDVRAIAPDEASKEFERQQATKELSGDTAMNGHKSGIKEEEEEQFPSSSSPSLDEEDPNVGSIASEDLVQAAVKMIDRRTFKSDGFGFGIENEAVEGFYSYLKGVAMDLPPNVERNKVHLSSKARKAVDSFFSLLPNDFPKAKSAAASRKRVKELPPDETGIDWKQLFDDDEIESCKVNELKARLRSVGMQVGGKKDELVAKVKESIVQEYTKSSKVKKEENEPMEV